MDDEKFNSNFLRGHFVDHKEFLDKIIASLRRNRSWYVGHVTRRDD